MFATLVPINPILAHLVAVPPILVHKSADLLDAHHAVPTVRARIEGGYAYTACLPLFVSAHALSSLPSVSLQEYRRVDQMPDGILAQGLCAEQDYGAPHHHPILPSLRVIACTAARQAVHKTLGHSKRPRCK